MNKTIDNNWYKHGISTVLICLSVGILINELDLFTTFNENWIDRDIRENGIYGAFYFLGLGAIATSVGAPRQMVAFLGGYAYGCVVGVLIATAATVLGCIMAFYTSKLILRPVVKRKFWAQSKKIDAFLQQNPIRKTIIIRLLPVGSNVITNIAAGTTSVSARCFFTGTAIGYIPQMFIFALLGKGIMIGSGFKIALSVAILLLTSFMSYTLYKKHKSQAISSVTDEPVRSQSSNIKV